MIEFSNASKHAAPKISINPAFIKYIHPCNRNDTNYTDGLSYIEVVSHNPDGEGFWVKESYESIKAFVDMVELTNSRVLAAPKVLVNKAFVKYSYAHERNDTNFKGGKSYVEIHSACPDGEGFWVQESYEELKLLGIC